MHQSRYPPVHCNLLWEIRPVCMWVDMASTLDRKISSRQGDFRSDTRNHLPSMHSLITSNHEICFKPNSSTVLCTTMLVETVQYYDENG